MLIPVFMGNGVLELQERALPQIKNPDDVLLHVEPCGLCGTDLNILAVPPTHKGDIGVVLGHEFVGTVVENGKGVKEEIGDCGDIAPRVFLRRIAHSEELWRRCLYTNSY